MPSRSKPRGGRTAAVVPAVKRKVPRTVATPAGVIYFAYGSNLDGSQMRERCPSARKVSKAVLHGYAIAFGGWSARWGGAVASIVPVRGSRVEGLLYRIAPEDLYRLDQFEGCPFAYERLTKVVLDEAARRCNAHVYLQTAADFTDRRVPSQRYFTQIFRAYERLGFSFEPLVAAIGEL